MERLLNEGALSLRGGRSWKRHDPDCFDSGVSFYRQIVRPLLFSIDAEAVHHLAMWSLSALGTVVGPIAQKVDPRLSRTVFGVTFPNPVGLAAGFDKNAVALPAWAMLGFGF